MTTIVPLVENLLSYDTEPPWKNNADVLRLHVSRNLWQLPVFLCDMMNKQWRQN